VDEKVLTEMSEVRITVSLALEARAKEGIKVRQPLAGMVLKNNILKGKDNLLSIVLDEVNVKSVTFNINVNDPSAVSDVLLDTDLTPELIQEGKFRELVRNVQELRKTTGLTPDDTVIATIETDEGGKELVLKFKDELMKMTLLKDVIFEKVDGGKDIAIDELTFKVTLKK
jgi:isoleucyl-tRNA synthetase